MPHRTLLPATYIATQVDLQKLVDDLQDESLLAIDTESNSLHAYQERVCLIQLSTRKKDYIIDPLTIDDLQPLGKIMASLTIQKIFHAAEYDILCLKRDFGFTFDNLFDTMVAARICGEKLVGLGNLLQEYAGVKVDKRHQRDNWGKRPLPTGSLLYAQMDTHYLPFLRDQFMEKLEKQGHLVEAKEIFNEIRHLPAATVRKFDPYGFWNLGKPYALSKNEMTILRELFRLREDIARNEKTPTFKVIENKTLIRLSRNTPKTINELKQIKGLSSRRAARSGKAIIRAIKRGEVAEHLSPPPRNRLPDPIINERYAALHSWRKERAIKRGVESDIIISKHILWDVAYKAPTTLEELQSIKGLGPWRFATYGEEILDVLSKHSIPEG
jgi:ribonuclease D